MPIIRSPNDPATYVITQQCIGLAFAIINSIFVVKEIRKRMRDKPKFKLRSLKWLSFLSIIGGFIQSVAWMLHYYNGLCLFLFGIYVYIGKSLTICVGFYQLTRLYQCFASKNVAGGYPMWLFCAMGTFGILYTLAFAPYYVWNERKVTCGLTAKYVYHSEWHGFAYRTWANWGALTTTSYLVWDITTLLLFVFKLRSLTHSYSPIGSSAYLVIGIRRNMIRMLILTISYMMMAALHTIFFYYIYYYLQIQHYNDWYFCIDHGLYLLSSTTMSYAVFLMERHNTREYGQFLKWIICCKLHYLCCCYHDDVVAQRYHYLPEYKTAYNITATGLQLEVPLVDRRKEREAFNDFSIDEPPSITAKYQAPKLSIIQNSVSTEEPQYKSRRRQWNDFRFQTDSAKDDEFSSGFSFGVYLEYWRQNRTNYVQPKFSTLKQELTMNRYAPITEEQYRNLQRQCMALQAKYSFTAKDIGTMNTVCGIPPGTRMSVDHVICLKLYTDFTFQQRIFKKHCRRLQRDEPMESVMQRNSEIAHWCRLLRESIMLYGETMSSSDVVYCGLNTPLIFRSLHQRFECPLSTTTQMTIAQQFAEGDCGVILKLKRANPKTRYFDVGPITSFEHEDERLFSGSTLKIDDIYIDSQSLKKYIKALRMLEQIANGHFVDFGAQTAELLLSLLHRVVASSITDALKMYESQRTLVQYLTEELYDTDAILNDVENVDDSNVMATTQGDGDDVLELIQNTLGVFSCLQTI